MSEAKQGPLHHPPDRSPSSNKNEPIQIGVDAETLALRTLISRCRRVDVTFLRSLVCCVVILEQNEGARAALAFIDLIERALTVESKTDLKPPLSNMH